MAARLARHLFSPEAAVLLLAIALRLYGVIPGNLSYAQVGDEQTVIGAALRMGEQRTLMARFDSLYYPPFMAYVYLPAFAIALGVYAAVNGVSDVPTLKAQVIADPWVPLLTARLLAVAAGTATVLFVMLLARRAFGRAAGIAAGLMLGTSLMHAQYSHFARMWVFTTAVVWLAALIALRLAERRDARTALVCGALAGFGFGVHVVGILCLILVPVAALWRSAILGPVLAIRHAVTDGVVAALPASLFAALAVWLAPQAFRSIAARGVSDGPDPELRSGVLDHLVGYAQTLLLYDPLLLLMAAGGTVLLARRRAWPLLGFLLCYPAAHIAFLLVYHLRDRFMLPLLPALAILASPGLVDLFRRSGARYRVGAAVLAAGMALQLGSVVHWDLLVSRTDTETQAREWIKAHVPNGSRVYALGADLDLPESRVSAAEAKNAGVTLSLKQQALLSGDLPEPHPAFVTAYFDQRSASVAQGTSGYLVVNEVDPARVPAEIQALAARAELVQEFLPGPVSRVDSAGVGNDVSYWSTRDLERLGPLVRVYRIEPVAPVD